MPIRRFYGSDRMMILITYDVNTEDAAGRSRLRKIAKKCVDFGQRVQNSVFECSLDAAQYRKLKAELIDLMDPKADSLRFLIWATAMRIRSSTLAVSKHIFRRNR